MESKVDELAKIIWDFSKMGHRLENADAILALGSMDLRIAERAAQLWHQKLAPIVVVSGGFGRLTSGDWQESEASNFRKILIKAEVPGSKIIVEDKSTNSAENFRFSINKLQEAGISPKQLIVVTKPYMERRAFATGKKLFPQIKFLMSSPDVLYENYPTREISKDLMINVMVGDLQRLEVYPAKGFTISQNIPGLVKKAAEELIKMGYDKQLIR